MQSIAHGNADTHYHKEGDMDILKLIKNSVMSTGGKLTITSALLVAGLLAAGMYFKLYVKQADTPAEQLVESILSTQGIDIDFSADKKD